MRHPVDVYLNLKDGKRVTGWANSPLSEGDVKITLERNDPFFKSPFTYNYENGKLVYSTAIEKEQNQQAANVVPVAVMQQQQEKVLAMFAQSLPEEKALEVPEVFPLWQAGTAYTVGQIVRFDKEASGKSKIFKVLQAHTSQADWLPQSTPALYKLISFAAGGIPNWVQPVGAVDAYKMNDIVMHKTKKWKSTAANNVWEPGVYGWVTIT